MWKEVATHICCIFHHEICSNAYTWKSSSIGMKLVQIFDFDNVHSVTSDILILQDSPKVLSDPILHQYYEVFLGLGELPGEYVIQIKPDSVPVVNPPCKLPVSLRTNKSSPTTPVTEPTPWVSSMVVA